MGNGIAHVFAMKDYQVALIDISEAALAKALQTVEKNLDRMVRKEKVTEGEKQATLANITTYTDMKVGVAKACLLYTSPSPRDKRQSRMPSSA